jgi:hypothetical protein
MDGGASPAYWHSGAQALIEVLPNATGRTVDGQTHEIAAATLAPYLADFFGA